MMCVRRVERDSIGGRYQPVSSGRIRATPTALERWQGRSAPAAVTLTRRSATAQIDDRQ